MMEDEYYTLTGYKLKEKQELSNAMEDYLEMIYRLEKEKEEVHILNLSLLLEILEQLGKNPYLKKVILLAKDDKNYKLYHQLINTIIHY